MTITQYECQACGWSYPPQSDIQSDTQLDTQPLAFADLPSSFSCPLCGAGKTEFVPVQATDSSDQHLSMKTAADDIVIIGAGLAGWAVVDALRAQDDIVGITLVTADSGARYHKPMLSVAFSQNKTAKDLMRASGEDASDKANITLLSHTTVHFIDSHNKVIKTDKGDVAYANLVLAMGATPAIPPCFSDLPEQEIWHINHIDSFHNIQQALSNTDVSTDSKHIAVIGAGMVGTEIAEDLTKAGHQVTLLDTNDTPLAMMLPSIVTDIIKEALEAQGIEFLGGSRVDAVERTPKGGYQLTITCCDSGKQQVITVDNILISTGLKVDPRLPNTAGINTDNALGIEVDEGSLQTQVPHIYAIGDCMSIGGIACRYVAPLRAQAATIAAHILGQQQPHYIHQAYIHKPPMIRLKNKSISISATGTPRADESHGQWRVVSDTQSETSQDMLLEQVTDAGEVVATLTVKQPL
ncbi:FAD-dependent oxidoreductase [Psychrobacter lutiphocae]|uniref:FAD-dependent oxidoreductase n=1 Tax=Psychrobacter lutiphocae TaxID=540500 RepID=UPI00036A16F8|nr:FAD-dependent oxidoreductase [Psychrobacter lutiphocae]